MRGLVLYDAGEGPPASNARRGWLRTGTQFTGSGLGEDSCDAWSSIDPAKTGRTGYLKKVSPTTDASFPWLYQTFNCGISAIRVWCIED